MQTLNDQQCAINGQVITPFPPRWSCMSIPAYTCFRGSLWINQK